MGTIRVEIPKPLTVPIAEVIIVKRETHKISPTMIYSNTKLEKFYSTKVRAIPFLSARPVRPIL